MRSTFTTLKAISIFLTKKRTYLVNCKKANILSPLLAPLLPPCLIFLWRQNAEKHFHFHSSTLISHLKAPSATINITAPTERDATMRNHQQSQEAICFNVECVLLQLTAIFLILWQLSSDTLWKTEGSVTMQLYDRVKYTVQSSSWQENTQDFYWSFRTNAAGGLLSQASN